MLDETNKSERIIDSLGGYFNAQKSSFEGAFVDDCCSMQLSGVFDPVELENSHYSGEEILDKIFHANVLNSEESISRIIVKCKNLSLKAMVYLNQYKINNSIFEACQYKDLVVVGDVFLANGNKIKLNFFDKLLHFTSCPVLLLAANQKTAKEIIFVYDGSLQSVNAIKTFIYLMPEYLLKSNVFLYVLVNESSTENEKEMVTYLKNHKQYFAIQHLFDISGWNNLIHAIEGKSEFLMVSGMDRKQFASAVFDFEKVFNFSNANASFFIA
jgi:hypothetical protein